MSDSPLPPAETDGNYVVVARRYRPRGFDELVGQDHVGRALKNAIETNRVGHAYLFTGARGVGKTSTARIFAKALNDPGGSTATPDNSTDIAQAIDAGEDVDVIEIDGASNRGIDEIRSLRANVGVRPSRCRYKIYIIDEVHMLTPPAFNALLKTLEEPPEHVKFIFCTTDPEKIPITVLSRCQRFDFAPVEVPKIVDRLREIVTAEQGDADDMALELIARRAAGSMRDSQSLLEQVLSFCDGKLTADQVHTMLGTADDVRLHQLARAMADRDAAEALRQMDAAVDAGVDAGRLAEQLLGYFRDLMAVAVGCDPSLQRHTSVSLHEELKSLAERWGLQTVLAVVGLVDQTLVRIRHSVYSRVLLESTLIQICCLPDLQNISDLAAAADRWATTPPAAGAEKKKGPLTPQRTEDKTAANPTPSNPTPSNPAVGVSTDPVRSQGAGPPSPPSHPAPQLASVPQLGSDQRAAAGDARPGQTADTPVQTTPDQTTPESIRDPGGSAIVSAEPGVTFRWDQAHAEQTWRESISRIESSMTETFAKVVSKVHASGDNTLTLVFPPDGTLAMKRCELPEHKSVIHNAVAAVAGRPITLEFKADPQVEKRPVETPVAKGPSRMQRMREIETNELVQTCIDVFEAQIVKIDKPR